jgi:hypothetical protein
MLLAVALASSWLFDTERVLMSSSSTPTDFVVSFCAAAAVEAIVSIAGISVGSCRVLEVVYVVIMWILVLGSFLDSTENSGLGGYICARSAHGLRLSQVTLYLGVYNRRMDGENVHKVYEKRKKSEGSEGGGSL